MFTYLNTTTEVDEETKNKINVILDSALKLSKGINSRTLESLEIYFNVIRRYVEYAIRNPKQNSEDKSFQIIWGSDLEGDIDGTVILRCLTGFVFTQIIIYTSDLNISFKNLLNSVTLDIDLETKEDFSNKLFNIFD